MRSGVKHKIWALNRKLWREERTEYLFLRVSLGGCYSNLVMKPRVPDQGENKGKEGWLGKKRVLMKN